MTLLHLNPKKHRLQGHLQAKWQTDTSKGYSSVVFLCALPLRDVADYMDVPEKVDIN